MINAPAKITAPTMRTRVGPARLRRRRRWRACRDISRNFEVTARVCDFLQLAPFLPARVRAPLRWCRPRLKPPRALRSVPQAMNPDTAELAVADPAHELAASFTQPHRDGRPATSSAGWWARMRADPARMSAMRDSARALWSSRLLVWVAGSGTVLLLGHGPTRKALDPPGLTDRKSTR